MLLPFRLLSLFSSTSSPSFAQKHPDDAKKLKAAFDAYDKDGNSVLDRQELQRFGEDCLKFLKKDVKQESFMVRLVAKGAVLTLDK